MSLKRKRDGSSASAPSSVDAVFRRHFEARFGSIDLSPAPTARENSNPPSTTPTHPPSDDDEKDGSDSDGSSWDGIDDTPAPEVISYDFSKPLPPPSTKPSTRRSFMSSKPPTSTSTTITTTTPKPTPEEAAADAENLKHDLALRRLLSESHLLDNSLSHASARHRQQALDARIVALGGTPLADLSGAASRTPMAIRQGMTRAQDRRAEKLRSSARENGIVLSKSQMKKTKKTTTNKKRDRGVGAPAVGKFRRGALILSRRDVAGMRA
ncbi:hypothetical protein Dda_0188 [Drechslerella dactyloides]|uniref:Uncharacterized protein n=1 Tax=Drechslerella dactyloides TaxID=74499 RepID=A0AAD6J429_DREDA|nr:hypothetical protein Dda_0188 [Drechslerella dactyloides]